jgi:hypothetical protein
MTYGRNMLTLCAFILLLSRRVCLRVAICGLHRRDGHFSTRVMSLLLEGAREREHLRPSGRRARRLQLKMRTCKCDDRRARKPRPSGWRGTTRHSLRAGGRKHRQVGDGVDGPRDSDTALRSARPAEMNAALGRDHRQRR